MIHTRLASVRFLLGFRPVLLLGILLGLGTAGLRAQFTFTWDGGPDSSYSGNWNDAQDWTANVGLPGPFDTAKFDINQTYTVNVGAAVLLSKVEVTAGDLTFNVAAGRELFINTELKVNSATLRVQGSAVTARHASLTNATLRLDGGVLILTEENSPINGLVEQGTLRVEGNGRIEANLDGYASPSNIINSASQSVIRANGGDLLVMLAPLTTQPGEERRILFSDIQDSERVWFGDVETQGNRLTFDAGFYRAGGIGDLRWRRIELKRGVTLGGGILDTTGGSIYFGPGFSSMLGIYADSTIRGHGLIETPNSITLDVASISLDGPLNFKGSAGIQIFWAYLEKTDTNLGGFADV